MYDCTKGEMGNVLLRMLLSYNYIILYKNTTRCVDDAFIEIVGNDDADGALATNTFFVTDYWMSHPEMTPKDSSTIQPMPQQSEATSATITRKIQILVRSNNGGDAVPVFVEPQATAHDLKNLMRSSFCINLNSCSFAFKSMLLQGERPL